jgi:hypothetical protein
MYEKYEFIQDDADCESELEPVRLVFTDLKFFLFNKFPLAPPQALVRNELHKFLDMEFFLSKVCRVQVFLLQ